MAIKDFQVDNNIDALALTETWFHDDDYDMVDIGTLCANGIVLSTTLDLMVGVGVLDCFLIIPYE